MPRGTGSEHFELVISCFNIVPIHQLVHQYLNTSFFSSGTAASVERF